MCTRPRFYSWLPIILVVFGLSLILVQDAWAVEQAPSQDVIKGAILYDNWIHALKVTPPDGNMPIWSRQTTNTRSGVDTWRCVECHGWDYRGSQGAYGAGSHFTGFPDVLSLAQELSEEEILLHLNGGMDPAHDFSQYLDETELGYLVAFLKQGMIDDSIYIDNISLRVIGGDPDNGEHFFKATCSSCHGEDGQKLVFRSEGIDEYLGDVAFRDPYRFLHRTRFGVAGVEMPIGAELGWSASDGRDVLAYAQTLPRAIEHDVPRPAVDQSDPARQMGGPANNWWTGFLTGLGAFFGAMGYALVFIGGFILIGFLAVIILRRRR